MQNAVIQVKTQESIGKIKKLNGGNLAPPLANEKSGMNIRKSFAELNMPLTRLHDAPLENAGMRLVDVPLIFANFDADESDPKNYYFTQTDDYIKNCIEGGTGIYFRLGVSIEHSVNKYFIDPPKDIDKWINICDRIIRHYIEGWGNGFNFFNMKYWEIWNEPEVCDGDGCRLMWRGTLPEFNRFYIKAATELKKRFPRLKFGGPAHAGYGDNGYGHLTREFINECAANHAPLDFYSYHCYSDVPVGYIQETPAMVRADLDAAGYKNSEIHLNEWHYFPGDWGRLRKDPQYKKEIYREMKGLNAAAFICCTMALWQDTPLDMGCYYTTTTSAWGIYQTGSSLPTKSYYGMKAYGEIVRYPARLNVASDDPDLAILAGCDGEGNRAMLISGFKCGKKNLTVDFDQPVTVKEVLMLDEHHNLESIPFTQSSAQLKLKSGDSSLVIVVKFQ